MLGSVWSDILIAVFFSRIPGEIGITERGVAASPV